MLTGTPAITRIVSNEHSVKDISIIAFPFAGGNANAFQGWKSHLPDNIEVLAYTPPGRGSRFGEGLMPTMLAIVDDAWRHFQPYLNKPFIIFGHSLGGLIAYEFLLRLHRENAPIPFHFIPSARKAPHLPAMQGWKDYSDDEFIVKLDELGGLHPEIASNQELIGLLTPILRNDINIVELYRPTLSQPLSCEVTVLGGIHDTKVPEEELWMWQQFFVPKINVTMYDEGHFYLGSSASAICELFARLANKRLSLL
ncbi:thioesterase II family protein [Alteromonas sp. a30]|uniref:thioesterase II family protein n=1 Tax=Alteromonas sp. a30 TaxID=2730917 RepID=UPI00227FF8E8|nr:alpha/beta fold hydrolase [Alteromonas sp. a30]MCY7294006.1 thioesterase [Alteromonas sp. a30]